VAEVPFGAPLVPALTGVMVVHKTNLAIVEKAPVFLPPGSIIVHVAEQFGQIAMWYRCDPGDTTRVERVFSVVGTGWVFADPKSTVYHVGTVLTDGGTFVWHVFEHVPKGVVINA
jgi:hypothetical protein